jgi:hypothetical protein
MRRFILLLARLYPRSWRRRYGEEFEALLRDLNPRWWDAAGRFERSGNDAGD